MSAARATPPTLGLPPIAVRHWRRMKARRVYGVTVSWAGTPRPVGAARGVTLRLLAAGAQVVPSEQFLDAAQPQAAVTFYVTPLAEGWLRAQRVEVLVQNRKLQEVPLATKVVHRRWALFFLALALLVPWAIQAVASGPPDAAREWINAQVPGLAPAIAQRWPAWAERWDNAWTSAGDRYADLHATLEGKALAFPVGATCAALALWALFCARDRRGLRASRPILVPSAVAEE